MFAYQNCDGWILRMNGGKIHRLNFPFIAGFDTVVEVQEEDTFETLFNKIFDGKALSAEEKKELEEKECLDFQLLQEMRLINS